MTYKHERTVGAPLSLKDGWKLHEAEMNETRLYNQTEGETDEGRECLLQDTNVLEEEAREISCPLLFFRSLQPPPRDLSAACIMHSQK